MGEATYYLKARFKDEETAKTVAPKLLAFLLEAGKAQDYWQANRGGAGKAAFWGPFKKQFPAVAKYLGSAFVGKDHNNALAGEISFGRG